MDSKTSNSSILAILLLDKFKAHKNSQASSPAPFKCVILLSETSNVNKERKQPT